MGLWKRVHEVGGDTFVCASCREIMHEIGYEHDGVTPADIFKFCSRCYEHHADRARVTPGVEREFTLGFEVSVVVRARCEAEARQRADEVVRSYPSLKPGAYDWTGDVEDAEEVRQVREIAERRKAIEEASKDVPCAKCGFTGCHPGKLHLLCVSCGTKPTREDKAACVGCEPAWEADRRAKAEAVARETAEVEARAKLLAEDEAWAEHQARLEQLSRELTS